MNREMNKERRRSRWQAPLLITAVFTVLIFSVTAGMLLGSANLSIGTVFDVLKLKLFGIESESLTSPALYIVWDLRLPRAVLAIAVGGGLAICGAAMQAVTQNVLADPYILGVSSGALAAVSFVFFLGGVFTRSSVPIQMSAFAGAIIALVLVYSVGMSGSQAGSTRLVLAGMAVSIILNAVSHFFIASSSAQTTRSVTMWIMGSLAGARWHNIALPITGSITGLVFFRANAGAYNLISLGDETAISLGINVARIKKLTTAVVAFVTGLIVSSCGLIGLVGFIVPHAVRMTAGADHRRLFPLTYLAGCLFLVWMDMLARFLMAPQEFPIGIFTAFFGGPFFVWLLYRQNKGE